jgi:hypothetical protein
MIITRLKGGLGNQMFQYAAARTLAHLHKTELKIDLSYLNATGNYTPRKFELNVFDFSFEFATEMDLKPFQNKMNSKILRTLCRKLPILFDNCYVAESGHAYHKEFMSYPKSTFLDGFWQTELYFKPAEDLIREDFAFKSLPEGLNKNIADKIQSLNSVSVHIRRGDYLEGDNKELYGYCDMNYYSKALDLIGNEVKSPELFIFSDDIAWAKTNLKTDLPLYFIDHNSGNDSYKDMQLMSLCKHHIVANSSFSWWGAWLNKNTDKKVIAPKIWYTFNDNKDICPPEWLRI